MAYTKITNFDSITISIPVAIGGGSLAAGASTTVAYDMSAVGDAMAAASISKYGMIAVPSSSSSSPGGTDISSDSVTFWLDPSGDDMNSGLSSSLPKQTFEGMMDAKPAIYHGALRFNLNKDATTSAQNTAKKVYTLSNQALQFMFPMAEGRNAETPYIFGGFTNELGDLTATAGSATGLTTNQNLTLDQYKGAILNIVSGAGAGQEVIIRGNTAGPNSVISTEVALSPAPNNTSVYRISYPNVELRFTQNVVWVPPPQSAIVKGVKFKYTGTASGVTMFIGAQLGPASGGVFQTFCCEYDFDSGTQKANLRCRGTGRFETDGVNSHWVGPNSPINPTLGPNSGCYFHDGAGMGTNVGGLWLGGASLIKNFTSIAAQSLSAWLMMGGTIENTTCNATGDSRFSLSGSSSVRGRIRSITGTAMTVQNMGKLTGNSGVGLDLVEFSDITGDLVVVKELGRAQLGDISVAGTNTGFGLKVQTGGVVRLQSSTLLSGNGGVIQVDSQNMTLAQALAAPFNGTLESNLVQPYVISDPGDGYAISVVSDGVCSMTSGATDGYRTMAAPSYIGQKIGLCFDVNGGGAAWVTIATGFNSAGQTTIKFTAAGQSVFLQGAQVGGAKKWRLVSNDGATLS